MSTNFTVPSLNKETAVVSIYGTRPLLCQRLARDKSAQALDKWPTTMTKMEDKLAWQYFVHSLYIDDDQDVAFPAVAIKKAASECRHVPGIAMTQIKGMFYVNGTPPWGYTKILSFDGETIPAPMEFIQDESDTFRWHGMGMEAHPIVDLVHIKRGGAIPVCYAQIELPWRIDVVVEWAAAVTNLQTIIDILEYAGDFNGIGCRRPERSAQGDYGRFTLSPEKAVNQYKEQGVDPKLYS